MAGAAFCALATDESTALLVSVLGSSSKNSFSASGSSSYVKWRHRFQRGSVVQKPLWSGSSIASDSQTKRMPGPLCAAPQAFACCAMALCGLDRGAVVKRGLLCSCQPGEVLARHADLHAARDLHRPRMLLYLIDEHTSYSA